MDFFKNFYKVYRDLKTRKCLYKIDMYNIKEK